MGKKKRSRDFTNKKLRDHFMSFGSLKKAAIHYGVGSSRISNILAGATPTKKMVEDAGGEMELKREWEFFF